jgi:hypothetical protein
MPDNRPSTPPTRTPGAAAAPLVAAAVFLYLVRVVLLGGYVLSLALARR